jgi:hypothetical protein
MSWLLRVILLVALALGSATAPSGLGPGSDQARAQGVALGAYIEGAAAHPNRIERYARLLGRQPRIVSLYKQWDTKPIVAAELEAVWNHGAAPMITWEPFSYHGRRYPLKAIAAGRYDRYVRAAGRAAARWGRPLLLRFAHEMNGDWYPWRGSPRRYKRAWRHVVRIFRAQGADNVQWVWSPYTNQGGKMSFGGYFPGDRWVDWVGLDGFNWGYGGSYFSFRRIFGRSYRALTRLSSRPVMIAETGADQEGKPRWIRSALRTVLRMPRVRALVWFDSPVNGVDLRFSSSRSARRAFRSAARNRRFAMSRECLLRISFTAGTRRPC